LFCFILFCWNRVLLSSSAWQKSLATPVSASWVLGIYRHTLPWLVVRKFFLIDWISLPLKALFRCLCGLILVGFVILGIWTFYHSHPIFRCIVVHITLMMLHVSTELVVASPFPLLILVVWIFFFSFTHLPKDFSILLIFLKNKLLASLIFLNCFSILYFALLISNLYFFFPFARFNLFFFWFLRVKLGCWSGIFFILICLSTYFSFSNDFTVLDKFWYIVLPFSFVSKYFIIPFVSSSLVY
jgi:hypothetical protein